MPYNVFRKFIKKALPISLIKEKRRQVRETWLERFDATDDLTDKFTDDALFHLFELYDQLFFEGSLGLQIAANNELLQIRAKKSNATLDAGCYFHKGNTRKIYIYDLFIKLVFDSNDHFAYRDGGSHCYNRLDCLQFTLEHEIVHLITDLYGHNEALEENHGPIFKALIEHIFNQFIIFHEYEKPISKQQLAASLNATENHKKEERAGQIMPNTRILHRGKGYTVQRLNSIYMTVVPDVKVPLVKGVRIHLLNRAYSIQLQVHEWNRSDSEKWFQTIPGVAPSNIDRLMGMYALPGRDLLTLDLESLFDAAVDADEMQAFRAALAYLQIATRAGPLDKWTTRDTSQWYFSVQTMDLEMREKSVVPHLTGIEFMADWKDGDIVSDMQVHADFEITKRLLQRLIWAVDLPNAPRPANPYKYDMPMLINSLTLIDWLKQIPFLWLGNQTLLCLERIDLTGAEVIHVPPSPVAIVQRMEQMPMHDFTIVHDLRAITAMHHYFVLTHAHGPVDEWTTETTKVCLSYKGFEYMDQPGWSALCLLGLDGQKLRSVTIKSLMPALDYNTANTIFQIVRLWNRYIIAYRPLEK